MIKQLRAIMERVLGGQVANLPSKLLFAFLIAITLWLGVNIIRVGGGDGLVAAGPLNGRAKPSSVTASAPAPSAPAPEATVATKRTAEKAGQGSPPASQSADDAASAAGKSSSKEGDAGKQSAESSKQKVVGSGLPPSFEQLTVLAALCGALGATLHALGSLVAFVGNGRFTSSWALWYLAQPVRGAVLASGVYWAWYGNLLDATTQDGSKGGAGALGLMFMVGLFSDPALEKLREVFLVLFRTGTKARTDPLDGGRKPVISKARAVTVGGVTTVELDGEGFEAGDDVMLNGNKEPLITQTAKTIVVAVPAALAVTGTKLVVIVRPTSKGAIASAPATLTVP